MKSKSKLLKHSDNKENLRLKVSVGRQSTPCFKNKQAINFPQLVEDALMGQNIDNKFVSSIIKLLEDKKVIK